MSQKSKQSSGILLYRFGANEQPEILLLHPGGPFWAKKDSGAWTIPKGGFNKNEDALENAQREFEEETGVKVNGNFVALTPLKQKSGKVIHAWMMEGDLDAEKIKSNCFEIEWPPKTGKVQQFPEVDKGAWFTTVLAREKINAGQIGFIDEFETSIKKSINTSPNPPGTE